MSRLAMRTFLPGDLDRVSGIESRIAGHSRRGFLEKRHALSASSPEGFLSCVAVDGGTPVGYAFARLAGSDTPTEDRIAVLDILGVDPAFQGTGIGRALIAGIEEQLRGRGFRTLRTEVVWTNGPVGCLVNLISPEAVHADRWPDVERLLEGFELLTDTAR